MAVRKSGLGRGLDALIPAESAVQGYTSIPLDAISPNPQQPRQAIAAEALQGLAASIREVGVLQPIVVRHGEEPGTFVLIAGERRWRAARLAGLKEIAALVREGDDTSGLAEALVENVQREDLTPLEEAAAYRQLLEDCGLTHEEVGARVGRSRPAITNTLRLLQLPASIQGLLAQGELTAGHCRAVLALDDMAYAEELARRAAEEGWPVRRLEEAVRARQEGLPPPVRVRRERPAEVLALEEWLAERLEAPVAIEYGKRGGGRLTVRFGSLEDLERIYRALLGD
ncbi:MAG: ParB/RepB/Spo0J family partition protein [Acidimicrobiia bacterium]|nr:ParB/RepB/Spo0J family partition protein [Acidimicrobiia bacterium]